MNRQQNPGHRPRTTGSTPNRHWQLVIGASLVAPLLVASIGCTSNGSTDDAASSRAKDNTTRRKDPVEVERPDGPSADMSEELTGGKGVMIGDLSALDLKSVGYVQHEFVAQGTAASYRAVGELPADGRFELEAGDSADYRTRVIVRRPEKASDFNGTVVVEWLNVSGGLDANPDWAYTVEEITRRGYAWAGVSAQHIGVEGGEVAVGLPAAGALAGSGLKRFDPERYGSLHHPGDAYAMDIFTQVGRAIRGDDAGGVLGDLVPTHLLAAGESQSGFMLTTYVNGVEPLARMFDGYLIHSRGGAAAPLGEPGKGIQIAATILGDPVKIRTDLTAPVLILESESDVVSVLNYKAAEQDDTELIRVWEMAGTAHVDLHVLGPIAETAGCGAMVNSGPHHFIAKAALRALDIWVRDRMAPATADRLATNPAGDSYQRDGLGIVIGGIRTPQVDEPVDVLSSVPGPNPSTVCLLMGSTVPIPDAELATLYPSRDDYLTAFESSTDDSIDAGFVLAEDRAAMLADAQPDRIPA
ncbi:MAG: alpha/beta hydrolase domain-containing protein [Microthrixaceae bacterium]